jgi:small subunit ribosomal protein S17
MTENEQNVNDEQTPEAAEEAAAEAPAEETAPEEPAAEEPVAEELPADEPAAAEPAAEAAPSDEAEPAEALSPKERRRAARSTHTGESRPQRSPEERAQERAEWRRQKAQRRRVYRQRVRERRAAEGPREGAVAPERGKAGGIRKVRQGVVVSDKADKTITVRIDVVHQHRMYKKIVRASSTLHAHDENNEAHVGDTVRVVESRPLSRMKRWRLTEILERAR